MPEDNSQKWKQALKKCRQVRPRHKKIGKQGIRENFGKQVLWVLIKNRQQLQRGGK